MPVHLTLATILQYIYVCMERVYQARQCTIWLHNSEPDAAAVVGIWHMNVCHNYVSIQCVYLAVCGKITGRTKCHVDSIATYIPMCDCSVQLEL